MERGPLTERILTLADRKGIRQRHLAQLAGMKESTLHSCIRRDSWSYVLVCDLATALNERVDTLLDVTEVL